MDKAIARIDRVLILRLCRGEDIVGSIRSACAEHNIQAACIMSMVGSVQEAVFYDPRPDDTDPAGISYGEPIYVRYPAELIGAHGEISRLADGKTSIHIHAAFADTRGRLSGGHLMGEGNKVLNTVNIFIGIMDGVELGVKYDPVLQAPCFCPRRSPVPRQQPARPADTERAPDAAPPAPEQTQAPT